MDLLTARQTIVKLGMTIGLESTAPEGWEVTKGSGVEIIDGQLNKYGKESNPNDLEGNYVELDGINSSGIAQSIETNVGQTYDLAFDFGARDAHGGDG